MVFLADDLGWADVGFHGGAAATPHLDRLAADGLELSRFYVFPLCTPTRYAFLTGRNPVRDGFLYAPHKPWDRSGIAPELTTLPELLRDAGYQTWLVGKWHLGHARREFLPRGQGFDHFYGCLSGMVGYFDRAPKYGAHDWQRNGESVRDEGYATDLLAEEAVQLLRARDPGSPFFLFLPFTAPHLPLEAPEERVANYAKHPDDRAVYLAMVESLDRAVGRVIDALEEEGIRRETLVLFFNDNGAALREEGANAPYEGGKHSTREGGIRAPALLSWPGVFDEGVTSDPVISVMDWLPTLAAAAGVPPEERPAGDGRDVFGELRTGSPVPGREIFLASATGQYRFFALFDGEWKLFVKEPLARGPSEFELYRIAEDDTEQNDLAAEHPDVVARLAERAAAWRDLHPERSEVGGMRPWLWRAPDDWADAAE